MRPPPPSEPPSSDEFAPTVPRQRPLPPRANQLPVTIQTADLAPNSIAGGLGKYRLGAELGRGGMGVVNAALDPALRRKIAVKTLLRADDPQHRSSFIEEAQITGQLEHPNIVPIHELGDDGQGRPFLAMKRIEGRTLRECIRESERKGHAWPADEAAMLAIFVKVCEALAYAHARGVIHRDLKPENVMVGEFGEVLVMDWGLAKPLAARDIRHAPISSDRRDVPPAAAGKLTMQGDVFGTPAYMPPEQARGDHAVMDERADIFALGAILYSMLALRAPYAGRHIHEVLDRARRAAVVPARQAAPRRQIPAELAAIAHQAMAAKPADRYASVADLLADVAAYRSFAPIRAHRDRPLAATIKWMRRHPRWALGGALSLVFSLIVSVLGMQLTAAHQQAELARHAAELSETNRVVAEQLASSEAARANAEAARRADAERIAAEREEMLTKMQAGDYQHVLGLLEAQVHGARDAAIAALKRHYDAARAAKQKYHTGYITNLSAAELDEVLAAFDRLIEQHETRGVAITARDYFFRGLLRHVGKNDLAGALADYDRAIALNPTDAVAFTNRGFTRQAAGDLDGAMADYNRAIALDPDDPFTLTNRGAIWAEKGNREAAMADYDRAIANADDHAMAYANRGLLRADIGDWAGAFADYNRAIALDASDARAFTNRGIAHGANGHLDAAMADLDRAIALDPQSASAFMNRAIVWAKKGNTSAAVADLDHAIALDPKNWKAWQNRAAVTQATDPAATRHALQQAFRICDNPAEKQRIAQFIRQLGGTVPE